MLARAQQGSVADVYVIEASVSDPGAGLRLLTELRARPQSRHAAIVIVHDVTDTETAVNALDLGASDLLELGFHPQEMALRLTIQLDRKRDADRLRETVAEGLRLAVLDPLTGLFNRRYAMAHIARTAERAAQTGKPYAVVLADIDLFKSVNDRFGHPAGDAVIAHVAQSLRNHLRPIDMVSRIGGEEFMIVIPETSPARAEATAKRLCAAVRARSAPVAGAMGGLPVTVSLGVSMGAPGERPENAIDRADRALYAAKEAGRDKVSVDSMNAA
ncbi:MAG: diguanylate cyclase [Alphaproteobacteria bacterium]|nr:diguanylate cyclase [Alphaproteobacteria bacterium]